MKLLLLFVLCIFSTYVFAQLPKKTNPYSFQFPDTLKRFKGNENAMQQLRDYWKQKQMQNNLRADNNNSIVILPQDRMPCVVPNNDVAAKIPNAWTGSNIPYIAPINPIPNPALPKIKSFKWNVFDNSLGNPSK